MLWNAGLINKLTRIFLAQMAQIPLVSRISRMKLFLNSPNFFYRDIDL